MTSSPITTFTRHAMKHTQLLRMGIEILQDFNAGRITAKDMELSFHAINKGVSNTDPLPSWFDRELAKATAR